MKVILFDSNLDGHHAEYASYIARYLLESGDDVTFVTSSDPGSCPALQALVPELQVHRLEANREPGEGRRWRRLIASNRALRQAMQYGATRDPCVFHHLFLDGAELAWLAEPRRDNRAFATFSTLFGLRHEGRPAAASRRSSAIALAKRAALRRAIATRRLDGIFVHSTRIRTTLLEILGRGVDPSSLTVVPDPAPPINETSKAAARARLRLPAEKPILLFFGGLRHDKVPDILLRALPYVQGDWCAVIAGEPLSVSASEMQDLAASPSVTGQILLRLGVIPQSEVDDYFASADAVVLPYRRSFAGTSGVLGRAAAAGRPIIATDVGDVGDIVRDHDLGLVVPTDSEEAFAAGIASFFEQREELAEWVTPRAFSYARENSPEQLGRIVRASYVARLAVN